MELQGFKNFEIFFQINGNNNKLNKLSIPSNPIGYDM